ncbi:hypothetical protein [Cytophaga hutchinsonii]|nr:hypothetical protein [Cytophaga hutchinsonii]
MKEPDVNATLDLLWHTDNRDGLDDMPEGLSEHNLMNFNYS